MAIRRPQWIRELQNQDIPDQITVLRSKSGKQPMKTIDSPIGGKAAVVGYTGAGPDGVVQADKPTDLIQTTRGPRMVHEDETISKNPNGTLNVHPSDDQISQEELAVLEKERKIKGYETGTGDDPISLTNRKVDTPFSNFVSEPHDTTKPGTDIIAPPPEPVNQAVTPALPPMYAIPAGTDPLSAPAGQLSSEQTAERSYLLNTPDAQLSSEQLAHKNSLLKMQQAAPTNTAAEVNLPGQYALPAGAYTPADEVLFTTPEGQLSPEQMARKTWLLKQTQTSRATMKPYDDATDRRLFTSQDNALSPEDLARKRWLISQGQGPTENAAEPIGATSSTPWVPTPQVGGSAGGTGTAYDRAIRTGLQRIQQVVNGMSPADQAIANRYLAMYNSAAGANRIGVMAQLSSDPTLSEGAKRALAGEFERTSAIGRSDMLSDLAINQMQRADAAAGQLAGLGFQGKQEDRDQAIFDVEQRNRVETDASAYFASMDAVEGYSWRNDPDGTQRLQRIWEAQGHQGVFDPAWADSFVAASTVSLTDAFASSITGSSWYAGLPDTTVYDDDGNVVTLGKDGVTAGISQMQYLINFQGFKLKRDANGNIVLVDPADEADAGDASDDGTDDGTGDDEGGGDDTPGGGVPGYNADDPDSVHDYANAWEDENDMAVGFNDAGYAAYRAAHDGDEPEDAEEFEEWSWEERTYNPGDASEIDKAYDVLMNQDEIMMEGLDPPMVRRLIGLYLSTHGGSFNGNADTFISWFDSQGNPKEISTFLSDPDSATELSSQNKEMLRKANEAAALVTQRGDMTDDEWEAFAVNNGFENAYELEWYGKNGNVIRFGDEAIVTDSLLDRNIMSADFVPGTVPPRTSDNTPITSMDQVYGKTIQTGDTQNNHLGGTDGDSIYVHSFGLETVLDNQPNRTILNLQPDTESVQWARDNAGKAVNINGRSYILAPETELFFYGELSGGGERAATDKWREGETLIPGFRAYDPDAGKWVVLSPTNWENRKVLYDHSVNGNAVTTRMAIVDGNWGVYDTHNEAGAEGWIPGASDNSAWDIAPNALSDPNPSAPISPDNPLLGGSPIRVSI